MKNKRFILTFIAMLMILCFSINAFAAESKLIVTIHPNGSNVRSAVKETVISCKKNYDAYIPGTPKREGYIFDGWLMHKKDKNAYSKTKISAERIQEALRKNEKNVTIYAKWLPMKVQVTYKDNKGKTLPCGQMLSIGGSVARHSSAIGWTTKKGSKKIEFFAGQKATAKVVNRMYSLGTKDKKNSQMSTLTLYPVYELNKK